MHLVCSARCLALRFPELFILSLWLAYVAYSDLRYRELDALPLLAGFIPAVLSLRLTWALAGQGFPRLILVSLLVTAPILAIMALLAVRGSLGYADPLTFLVLYLADPRLVGPLYLPPALYALPASAAVILALIAYNTLHNARRMGLFRRTCRRMRMGGARCALYFLLARVYRREEYGRVKYVIPVMPGKRFHAEKMPLVLGEFGITAPSVLAMPGTPLAAYMVVGYVISILALGCGLV